MKIHNLIFVGALIISVAAKAQTCSNLFLDPQQNAFELKKSQLSKKMDLLSEYHRNYTNKALTDKDLPERLPDIIQMAKKVIQMNYKELGLSEMPQLDAIEYSQRYLNTQLDTNYFIFTFQIGWKSIKIRSNGFVTFLYQSYMYRIPNEIQHYQMAYLYKGEIISGNQTEFLISTFPKQFSLSRDMGRKERNRWLNGESFYSDGRYGSKVHMAPNYFRFKDYQPYMIHFTRDQLLDFYLNQGLEINTYDYIPDNKKLVRTQMKLETEVVFVGQTGINQIAPMMKEQLSQDVLGF